MLALPFLIGHLADTNPVVQRPCLELLQLLSNTGALSLPRLRARLTAAAEEARERVGESGALLALASVIASADHTHLDEKATAALNILANMAVRLSLSLPRRSLSRM